MEENWKKLELKRELDLCGINYWWKKSKIQLMRILTKIDIRSKILGD